jgi:uncharacterized protein
MTDSVYMEYNPWWEEEYETHNIIERPSVMQKIQKWMDDDRIITLTGLRRIGKTTIMKLLIKKLIQKGIDPGDIFYVSLDDFSLDKLSIMDIVNQYRTLRKLPIERKVFLFLDEVTYKDRFNQQLKTLHDRQNVKIVASSSSSSVLKDKMAFLTGREIIIKIFPLEFSDYLIFKNIQVKGRDERLKEKYFEDYMQTGGVPGYVLNPERETLKTLVDDIIYKDIIAYNNIRNKQVVKEFFSLLMERAGKQVSINKMSNILKISPDTAKRYLALFEQVYLVYTVSRHGTTNEQMLAPQKIYAADLGIRHLFTGFRDKGSIFENYIYMVIKNKNPQFINYVYENKIEIDFLIDKCFLVEAKYGQLLKEKQEALFNRFNAQHKLVIHNRKEIKGLEPYFTDTL